LICVVVYSELSWHHANNTLTHIFACRIQHVNIVTHEGVLTLTTNYRVVVFLCCLVTVDETSSNALVEILVPCLLVPTIIGLLLFAVMHICKRRRLMTSTASTPTKVNNLNRRPQFHSPQAASSSNAIG